MWGARQRPRVWGAGEGTCACAAGVLPRESQGRRSPLEKLSDVLQTGQIQHRSGPGPGCLPELRPPQLSLGLCILRLRLGSMLDECSSGILTEGGLAEEVKHGSRNGGSRTQLLWRRVFRHSGIQLVGIPGHASSSDRSPLEGGFIGVDAFFFWVRTAIYSQFMWEDQKSDSEKPELTEEAETLAKAGPPQSTTERVLLRAHSTHPPRNQTPSAPSTRLAQPGLGYGAVPIIPSLKMF